MLRAFEIKFFVYVMNTQQVIFVRVHAKKTVAKAKNQVRSTSLCDKLMDAPQDIRFVPWRWMYCSLCKWWMTYRRHESLPLIFFSQPPRLLDDFYRGSGTSIALRCRLSGDPQSCLTPRS